MATLRSSVDTSAPCSHCDSREVLSSGIEIYFSILQGKVLTPNDFVDLDDVEGRLLAFERRYETAATPFEWKFTGKDLTRLMQRLREKEAPAAA